MPCYHPAKVYPYVDYRTGEIAGWKYSPSGVYIDKEKNEVQIPCGKCIGCRLDHSRTWADRMMLELDHSKTGIFVTLTYDDDHLPFVLSDGEFVPSLFKRDCQLFMKSLRKHFSDKTIRFYLCGEYGPSTHRPHYHAILFGLSLSDFPDLVQAGSNFVCQNYYNSKILSNIWKRGFVTISEVSWRTCAYVARYVQKKAFKDDSFFEDYPEVVPEFSLMSRRPGIAGYFIDDHPEAIGSSSYFISNPYDIDKGSKKVFLPKYITKSFVDIAPDLYYQIKKERLDFMEDRRILELQNTDLDFETYLGVKEASKISSVKRLIRKDV